MVILNHGLKLILKIFGIPYKFTLPDFTPSPGFMAQVPSQLAQSSCADMQQGFRRGVSVQYIFFRIR